MNPYRTAIIQSAPLIVVSTMFPLIFGMVAIGIGIVLTNALTRQPAAAPIEASVESAKTNRHGKPPKRAPATAAKNLSPN